ncbi:hypothetical protein [Verminephrobacter eiseniae]|uniref:hypothetical protein n=1 Tax=Verminephrobacter eiseniae TaxID=364317 RepID=UPI002239031A|nr:hypothetical protein [Verminephrobacter eiseniae]
MSVQIEALFTATPGLQAPWVAWNAQPDGAEFRIDFDVECNQVFLACSACGTTSQKVHDRLPRSWRQAIRLEAHAN